MEYEVDRSSRQCHLSGRALMEGETYYAALVPGANGVERLDFAAEVWPGPPEEALAWWKARVPTKEAKKTPRAPNDVLLQLFTRLEGVSDKTELRYVLALLLIQRRVLRQEDPAGEPPGGVLTLYCSRDETTHVVPDVLPNPERLEALQTELSQLLSAS